MFLLDSCTTEPPPAKPEPTVKEEVAQALNANSEFSNFRDIFEDYPLPGELPDGITLLVPLNSFLISPATFELDDYLVFEKVDMSELVDGATLKSVSNKSLTVDVVSGKTYINSILIDESNSVSSQDYSILGLAGVFQKPIDGPSPGSDDVVYYITYYENGIYYTLEGKHVSTWPITNQPDLQGTGGCSLPDPSYSYAGTSVYSAVQTTYENPFVLRLQRATTMDEPKVGDYSISPETYDFIHGINTGTCNLSINTQLNKYSAVFSCEAGDKDASIDIKVEEVKILDGSGLTKRGYYRGTFEAILYYSSDFGAAPVRKIITSGKFSLPFGGVGLFELGKAPKAPTEKLVGKWFLKKFVHYQPEYEIETLDPDDAEAYYLQFASDGQYIDSWDGDLITGRYRVEGSTIIYDESRQVSIKELTEDSLIVNYVSADPSDEAEVVDLFYER